MECVELVECACVRREAVKRGEKGDAAAAQSCTEAQGERGRGGQGAYRAPLHHAGC
jgi:hypothetical protein